MVDPDYMGMVLEMASGFWKVGFSGDDAPRAIFPSVVGRPKNPGIMVGMDAKDCFVGYEAQSKRGLLNLKHPVPCNSVGSVNYTDLEKMFHHSSMVIGMPCMKKRDFERVTSIMFETFHIPAFAIADAPVLSLYASGRTNGVSVDCGHSVCISSPIYGGTPIRYAKVMMEDENKDNNPRRRRIGGQLVTETLQKLINESKRRTRMSRCIYSQQTKDDPFEVKTEAEKEICRDIKERMCCLEVDPKRLKDLRIRKRASYFNPGTFIMKPLNIDNKNREQLREYELPDGSFVDIGVERYEAGEILFHPRMIGYNIPGIHEIIKMSVEKCHPDLQKEMYENIVVNGGTSMLENFRER